MEITINIKGLDGLAAAVSSLASVVLPVLKNVASESVAINPEPPALLIDEPFTPVTDIPKRRKRKPMQHEFIRVAQIARDVARKTGGDKDEIREWIYANYGAKTFPYNGYTCVRDAHRKEILKIYNV